MSTYTQIKELERELAKAQKEKNDALTTLAMLGDKHERELADITKQRDALAKALRNYMYNHRRHGFVTFNEWLDAEQALAATKGGSDARD